MNVLYHMSQTLQLGDEVKPDFKGYADLAEPFVKALNYSHETFYAMFLNAGYVGAVLAKYDLKGLPTHEIKWATEGVFEYIRRKEFPDTCSRLTSTYYFDDLEKSKKLYIEDWEEMTPEEREKTKLFEMEVDGNYLEADMELFDEAFDLIWDMESPQVLEEVFELARKYFRGERSDEPEMEILSDAKAVARKDLTDVLRQWKTELIQHT